MTLLPTVIDSYSSYYSYSGVARELSAMLILNRVLFCGVSVSGNTPRPVPFSGTCSSTLHKVSFYAAEPLNLMQRR